MSSKIDVEELIDVITSSYEDIDQFYKRLLTFLSDITDSEIVGIYFPDNISNKGLELKYLVEKSGHGVKFIKHNNYYLPFDKGIVGWVYRNKSMYVSDNTETDKFYVPLDERKKSDIAVPIISYDGKVVAVINFENYQEDKYSKEDLEKISIIIPLVSTLIEYNTRIETKEYEAKFYRLLYSVYRIFQSLDDLDSIFNKLMNFLIDNLRIERGMIFLLDDGKNELSIIKSFGLTGEEASRGVYSIGEGIVGTVALTGKPISIPNIWEDKRFLGKTKAKRSKAKRISFFANPIMFEDNTLGVILIEKEFTNSSEFEVVSRLMKEVSELLAISVLRYSKAKKEKEDLISENEMLREQLLERYGVSNIVGKSQKMLDIFEIISIVSKTNSTVLIEGESGTGKELIAKTIHYASNRKDKPFVAINCAAIPETLLESELFGYKKGAFTGAISDKKGKILQSEGGTLFLDEIGDMPLSLQAKILRVIQEREVEPIGGTPVKVDIRIIAATNKNLESLVEEGKFRLDLYYRLNVVKIEVPPLRDRKDDIPLLVDFFVNKFSKEHSKNIEGVEKDFMELFLIYEWPGNVRELENVIEHAVIMSKDKILTKDLLPRRLREISRVTPTYEERINQIVSEYVSSIDLSKENELYDKVIDPILKSLINQVVVRVNNNKVKASEILGINRNTLFSYMKKYRI
ncbi:MAG: sigma 54-interacting transcriptional regulator [Spirochaetia bacterium]|nr:sigma 54-interacting transcriptional regulator [Spirochaetota bacterium]MCX8097287.1 sigma 54-interacting transcriptional regulator [Spirochaetota bacterium]MDW8112574.1 sigma 54-interacting transcriptional regulator [Spirochaetia bacterium]